jgi:hypothetical protein
MAERSCSERTAALANVTRSHTKVLIEQSSIHQRRSESREKPQIEVERFQQASWRKVLLATAASDFNSASVRRLESRFPSAR